MENTQRKPIPIAYDLADFQYHKSPEGERKIPAWLALLAFFVSYGVMHYPVFHFINTGFIGGSAADPAIYVWLTYHNNTQVLTWPSVGFDSLAFFPFGNSLAYTDNYLLPSLFSRLWLRMGASLELAHNASLVAAGVLNGACTFFLALRVNKNIWAAATAGLAFQCLPFFNFHFGHPQLQYAFVFPLMSLVVLRYFECPSFVRGCCIGTTVIAAFLCSAYYGVFSAIYAPLFFVAVWVMHRARFSFRQLINLVFANLLPAFALYALIQPYLDVRTVFKPINAKLTQHFASQLTGYFAASPIQLLWGTSLVFLNKSPDGSYFFIGIILSLATVVALVKLLFVLSCDKRTQALLGGAFLLFAALVALHFVAPEELIKDRTTRSYFYAPVMWVLVCSASYALWVVGRFQISSIAKYSVLFVVVASVFMYASFGVLGPHGKLTPFSGLYALLYWYAPGVNGLRAVNRIGVVSAFALIILGSIGITRLLSGIRHSRVRSFVGLGIFLLVAAELKTQPIYTVEMPQRPQAYDALATLPDGAVVNLPFYSLEKNAARYSDWHPRYMLWATQVNRQTMSGYSGKIPGFFQKSGPRLDTFPSDKSLQRLGQFVGLKYVIVDLNRYGKGREAFFEEVQAFAGQVKLLGEWSDGSALFEIAPELTLLKHHVPELFLPPDESCSRRLEVELFSDTAPRTERVQLGSRKVQGGYFEHIQEIHLEEVGVWQKIVFQIPPSRNSVIPHKVRFDKAILHAGGELRLRVKDVTRLCN